ncbi:hypothetical protein [Trujillonella humicola]|uniref:hypothetical protein n=1 Tax=Trujillonella humicola TaxID=3383699 RepID=UPI0039059EC6
MTVAARALALAGAVAVALLGLPGTAHAAPEDGTRIGYDVSHPQCGEPLPRRADVAIVGVNGGIATVANPCLAEQLAWAADATGRAAVELYVNTANPGEVIDRVTTWPDTGSTPYGECDGTNSAACSWQYGRIRAAVDVHVFFLTAAWAAGVDPDPAAHRWWLDVETMNTWQYGSPGAQARNRAALEGMATYLREVGAEVGIYSTGRQWAQIAGRVPPATPLHGLDSWLAGARDLDGARATCSGDPLVPGGRVVLAQYVDDDLDHDLVCG